MPGLPDVESQKNYLEAHALDREISSTSVRDEKVIGETSLAALQRALKGARLTAARRHGKHLLPLRGLTATATPVR
jgi:formamidopyrimidine-DNA glycosylase